ncbi:hypothetical protein ACLOJK_004187 [Asimina triloba]
MAVGPYKVVSEWVLVMDSKRAADKGKAPMSEEEPRELPTRARRVAVIIGEPNIPGRTARVSSLEDRQYEESESMEISDDEQDIPIEGVLAFERGEGVSTQGVSQAMPTPSGGDGVAMAATLTQIMQPSQAHEEPVEPIPPAPVVLPVQEARRSELGRFDIKAFQKMKPPMFSGNKDFRVIDSWVDRIEKIFMYMSCPEEYKVLYVTYMLDGTTEIWWKVERRRLPDQVDWSDWRADSKPLASTGTGQRPGTGDIGAELARGRPHGRGAGGRRQRQPFQSSAGVRLPVTATLIQAANIQEAHATDTVVTGNLLISGCMTLVLFNSGEVGQWQQHHVVGDEARQARRRQRLQKPILPLPQSQAMQVYGPLKSDRSNDGPFLKSKEADQQLSSA